MWLDSIYTFLIAVSFCSTVHGLRCYTGSSTGKHLNPDSGEVECPTRCYTTWDDFAVNSKDSWQYGCMSQLELNKCGTTVALNVDGGSRKAYCCCNDNLCNTRAYGNNCWISKDTGLSGSQTVCSTGVLNKQLGAPTGSKNCVGQCYVEFKNYDDDKWDKWTYGCQARGWFKYCGQRKRNSNHYNNVCCCEGKQCNSLAFAQACAPNSVVNPVVPLAPVITGRRCRTGTSTGTLGAPNAVVACSTRCFVSLNDYTNNGQDVWTYGCASSNQLGSCGKISTTAAGSKLGYCCCNTANCNDLNYAKNCKLTTVGLTSSSTTCNIGEQSVVLRGPSSTKSCQGQCYVEFLDYENNANDKWTYGCQSTNWLKFCGQRKAMNGYTNNINCCEGAQCNSLGFAQMVIPNPKPHTWCKAGNPTKGKLTNPNLSDKQCYGICYVMHSDYDDDDNDSWTYGCLEVLEIKPKCGKTYDSKTALGKVTNGYCCCFGDRCNDRDFADEKCSSSIIHQISLFVLLPIAMLVSVWN